MREADKVAQELAAAFLQNGQYAFSNPMNPAALGQVLPATAGAVVSDVFEEAGFEGLSVQSVGYEEGADEPKVHVYVIKGGGKALKTASTV
jgi:hypothetical protein